MDPISQGAVGAAFAQSTTPATHVRWIALFGCLAGLAPDLDVFINSATDPLLFLEYHRQFSHALIFIPIGALLVAAPIYYLPNQPLPFATAYLAALAGYATHGLLDACTSYGTQLFWPFSDARISWNNISIIDPLFTLPVLALTVWAAVKRRRALAIAAMAWGVFYLLLGTVQQQRAEQAALRLAETRAHRVERLLVKPAFGNLLMWKSIYEHAGRYYVDALRATTNISHCGGSSIQTLSIARDLPDLEAGSQQALDLQRFTHFSMGFVARLDPADGSTAVSARVIDVRYSNLPHEFQPMWGIMLEADAGEQDHVRWWAQRALTQPQRSTYAQQISGQLCFRGESFNGKA